MDNTSSSPELSPLQLEELFRRSISEITLAADDASRVRVICQFINETRGLNEDLVYSFYLQYAGVFFYLLASMQPESVPPDELLTIFESAVNFYRKFPDKLDQNLIREGLTNLLFYLALQYFYLGELDRACQALVFKNRLLKGGPVPEAKDLLTAVCPVSYEQILRIKNTRLSNLEMCVEFFNSAGLPEEILADKDFIFEKWEKYRGFSSDSLYCSLVEKRETFSPPEKARIISLSAHGRKMAVADGQNIFKFSNLMSSLEEALSASLADGLEAADYVLHRDFRLELPPFFIIFSFPDKKFIYAGQSLGLPVTLLALSQKLRTFKAPHSLSISRQAAFTGRIDLNGQVLRIEPESLEMKIKAAFYSGLRYLVLPEENMKEASLILYQLLTRHPHRRLELIGAKSLMDIIEDERLIQRNSTSKIIWLIKTKRKLVAKTFFSVLFLTGLFFLFMFGSRSNYFPFKTSRPVVAMELHHDKLLAIGEKKEVLWAYQLKSSAETESLTQKLMDLEGDGKKEILVGVNYKEQEKRTSEILLFEPNGQLRWSFEPGKRIKTLNDEFSNNYIVRNLGIWKLKNNSEEKFILVVANHATWYPVQITLLNSSGRIIGEYWQAGHLNRDACLVEDIDEDGWNEIILGGTNNDFQCACLLVLDPRKVEGCSPSSGNPEFQFQGLPPGTQEYYILFPRTTLNQVMALRNYTRQLELLRTDKKIEASVTEFSKENPYEIIYNFDYHLQPLFSRPTDMTIEKIKEFMVQGILPPQALTELRILKEKIRFWDGEGWSYRPTRNKKLAY